MPRRRMLVLARHGQSGGNRRDIFTGCYDVPLTAQGIEEVRAAGRRVAALGIRFDAAFASALARAATSCELILAEMGRTPPAVMREQALNERDCGALTGLNKDDAPETLRQRSSSSLAEILRGGAARRRKPP